jgi:hypothetical protein
MTKWVFFIFSTPWRTNSQQESPGSMAFQSNLSILSWRPAIVGSTYLSVLRL